MGRRLTNADESRRRSRHDRRVPASFLPASRPRRVAASPRRLGLLLALLGVAVVLLAASQGWRRRMLAEAARYRQVAAEAQRSRSERASRREQERQLEAAVRARPGDLDARFELAQLRWSLVGPAGAIPVLEQWPAGRPEARALRMLAECDRLTGREDRTLRLLERAAALYPGDSEVHADRALFFSRLGWMPETQSALRRMEQAGAVTGHVALVRIAVARESADLGTAHRLLEEALRRAPGDLTALKQLAAVMSEEGKAEEAVRLIEQSPAARGDADAAILIARVRAQQGTPASLERALAAIERARALRPLEPGELLLQARCLRLSGRAGEARPILEALYRKAPGLLGLAFELAQVYRETAAAPPTSIPPSGGYPAALLARHAREQADEAAMRRAVLALRNRPADPAAHERAGLVCLRQRRYGRAIVELERALALDPYASGAPAALEEARQAVAGATTSKPRVRPGDGTENATGRNGASAKAGKD